MPGIEAYASYMPSSEAEEVEIELAYESKSDENQKEEMISVIMDCYFKSSDSQGESDSDAGSVCSNISAFSMIGSWEDREGEGTADATLDTSSEVQIEREDEEGDDDFSDFDDASDEDDDCYDDDDDYGDDDE